MYRKILKNKANICSTTSNSIIHHKSFLGLKHFCNLQTESQITNLINRLNDPGPTGLTTIICLKQLQIQNWEPTNILTKGISKQGRQLSTPNRSAKLLSITTEMKITFHSWKWNSIFEWQGGTISIKTILNDPPLYLKSSSSLKNKNLMYIDQLICPD